MRRHLGFALGLLLVVAAMSGCGKTTKPASPLRTSGATAVDIAQTNDAVAAAGGLLNEDQYNTAAQTQMSLGSGGLSLIRPIFWWRTIDSAARTVDFVYGDPDSTGRPTTAVATVHRHFVGTFNIFAGDTGTADTTRQVVRKPLDDLWTRHLMLKRFLVMPREGQTDTIPHFVWRVVGTSGVTVTSASATTHIVSLRIQAGTVDTTVTDPQQLYRIHRVLWLPDDTPVKVTVTTGRADDIVVLYHGWERKAFASNGDGTFTRTFQELDWPGMRHFGVNAFSHGTLWDDTAAYDSQAWVLPFAVRTADCWVDHD